MTKFVDILSGAAAGAVIEQYHDDVREAFVQQSAACHAGVGTDGFRWITARRAAIRSAMLCK